MADIESIFITIIIGYSYVSISDKLNWPLKNFVSLTYAYTADYRVETFNYNFTFVIIRFYTGHLVILKIPFSKTCTTYYH